MKKIYLTSLLAAMTTVAGAQLLKSGYVDWGITGSSFPSALEKWQKGDKWTDDDNFFISRIKPKQRFRNTATQINPLLTEDNDKKLIFWVPINSPEFNALPDGAYDREVFPMWSYITHYGNWSAPLVRMPGGFIDIAHKNGVPVSVVASIPYGNLKPEWEAALNKMIEIGPSKMADFMEQYGIDGLGYNSEFESSSAAAIMSGLNDFHSKLVQELKPSRMPLCENIWYDGTNTLGKINFDNGLGSHNAENWGYGDNIRTSLFFNYNWNSESLLKKSVKNAEYYGRSPLDLYCGINMQGREPHNYNPEIWPLLQRYPLSIGLWGAHSENMFFESRAEKGASPDQRQRSYLLRMERWFTGGSRNPVNTPEISNSLKCVVDNHDFFGMSKLMSARSALKWDLSEEPFISYFNLGNGKFFNYKGERSHSSEWYNIGMQDYLPTWTWWFSTKFLGKEAQDVPTAALDAEFVWDDAWIGGSCLRIHGSAKTEYLHLFKTEFRLQKGDIITVRHKVNSGSAHAYLALSVKGEENTPIASDRMQMIVNGWEYPGFWRESRFTVGEDLADKDLAMIAVKFQDANNLDMRLGEISIVRGEETSVTPAAPEITKAEILAAGRHGADGKIIFEMPNDKAEGVCYNIDVNTSLFKLYARQDGKEPILMGMTPSWAGLMFSIPVEYTSGTENISLGVSALSLDMSKESEITWSEPMSVDKIYSISDDISVDKDLISTGEEFSVSYLDPLHETGDWSIINEKGETIFSAENAIGIYAYDGISEPGSYTLKINGITASGDSRKRTERIMPGFIQVVPEGCGRIPMIQSLTANGQKENIHIEPGQNVEIEYSSRASAGSLSRGVKITDNGLGFNFRDTDYQTKKPFSISFWFKPETFANQSVHMLNIRDKGDAWANNNWGWFWHTLKADGTFDEFTIRGSSKNTSYRFDNTRMVPGVWNHITYVFDFNESGAVKPSFYLNGKRQEITSWQYGDNKEEGEPDYISDLYGWRHKNTVAIGGPLHKSGSVIGNVDNFMFWTKALDAEGVSSAMSDIDPSNLPADLAGYFNFDSDPEDEGYFISEGSKTFKAGMLNLYATEVEGQATTGWAKPEFCSGSPFIKGSLWNVSQTSEWTNYGGKLVSKSDKGTSGKAVINFPADGIYTVGLKISNEYGSDSAGIKINVGSSDITPVSTEERIKTYPNPFTDQINVVAPGNGKFKLILSDINGRSIMSAIIDAAEGEIMTIRPDVPAGIYLLQISGQNESYKTLKLIRK